MMSRLFWNPTCPALCCLLLTYFEPKGVCDLSFQSGVDSQYGIFVMYINKITRRNNPEDNMKGNTELLSSIAPSLSPHLLPFPNWYYLFSWGGFNFEYASHLPLAWASTDQWAVKPAANRSTYSERGGGIFLMLMHKDLLKISKCHQSKGASEDDS